MKIGIVTAGAMLLFSAACIAKENAKAETPYVARAGELVDVLRKHPMTGNVHTAEIAGVTIWPSHLIQPAGVRIFDDEGGKLDVALLRNAVFCTGKFVPPPGAKLVLIEATPDDDMVVPVFLDPDAGPLTYTEVSVDFPDAPVALVVVGDGNLALRITASRRTRLAAVHLRAKHPSAVLGVDPVIVTQQIGRRGKFAPVCAATPVDAETPAPSNIDLNSATVYRLNGDHRLAIGEPQPVKRGKPTLGHFFDPDLPAPDQYGLAVLAARGLIEKSGPRVYRVTGAIEFPRGLSGSHSVTFEIPEGVPKPIGNPGHSRVVAKSSAPN